MFESSVNSDGTQTTPMYCKNFRSVWEQCKFRWYSNLPPPESWLAYVWEQCKFRWYSNGISGRDAGGWFESSVNSDGTQTYAVVFVTINYVWEQCKFRWYSNATTEAAGSGSTDRPANGGSNGGVAVARAMAMPFFFCFRQIFFIFCYGKKKEKVL